MTSPSHLSQSLSARGMDESWMEVRGPCSTPPGSSSNSEGVILESDKASASSWEFVQRAPSGPDSSPSAGSSLAGLLKDKATFQPRDASSGGGGSEASFVDARDGQDIANEASVSVLGKGDGLPRDWPLQQDSMEIDAMLAEELGSLVAGPPGAFRACSSDTRDPSSNNQPSASSSSSSAPNTTTSRQRSRSRPVIAEQISLETIRSATELHGEDTSPRNLNALKSLKSFLNQDVPQFPFGSCTLGNVGSTLEQVTA